MISGTCFGLYQGQCLKRVGEMFRKSLGKGRRIKRGGGEESTANGAAGSVGPFWTKQMACGCTDDTHLFLRAGTKSLVYLCCVLDCRIREVVLRLCENSVCERWSWESLIHVDDLRTTVQLFWRRIFVERV